MRYAILGGDTVTNVIVADAEFAVTIGAIECPDDAGIGWSYDGTTWTAPAPELPPVPTVASMRQARLALLQAGKLANVETAINALASPAKEAALIEWNYATQVTRDSALLQQLAAAIGLTEADLDSLFTQAVTL